MTQATQPTMPWHHRSSDTPESRRESEQAAVASKAPGPSAHPDGSAAHRSPWLLKVRSRADGGDPL